MVKKDKNDVFVLRKETSRMGPDDEDNLDLWLEEFEGHQVIYFEDLDTIKLPDQVVFRANRTFDQTDYPSTTGSWVVFSPKLITILKDNDVQMNIFPIKVIQGGGAEEAVYDDYAAIQLLEHLDAIDTERSDLEIDDDEIMYIHKLVFKNTISKFPPIFRLTGYEADIFVNSKMKDELEKNNVKGVQFKTVKKAFF